MSKLVVSRWICVVNTQTRAGNAQSTRRLPARGEICLRVMPSLLYQGSFKLMTLCLDIIAAIIIDPF